MIVVNNPGTWRAVHPPLLHADWHGRTPTDVIFPFFLFIVGVAVPLALGPRREHTGRGPALVRVAWRSAVIFALGLVLNALWASDWSTLRIPGVLQRIAVCYLLAALLFLGARWQTHALAVGALLLGYWLAMTLVPVPGHGAGDLGKEGNLAAYVDRLLLGRHLWRPARVYDPEGILSTAPALATTLIGVLAGRWLRAGRPPATVTAGLALAGALAVVGGWAWGLVFPINKALWSSSYALLTAGLALLALALCHWLVEMRGCRRWAWPFAVLGVNALAVVFLSGVAARLLVAVRVGPDHTRLQAWLFERLFAPWADPADASLAYALAYLLLWWALVWALARTGIRLRV